MPIFPTRWFTFFSYSAHISCCTISYSLFIFQLYGIYVYTYMQHRNSITYNFMYLGVLLGVCLCLVWWRPKEDVRCHASRVTVRRAMWVLGPLEPKFSGRADSVLIHWIISPVNRKIYSQIYYFPIWGFWILIVSKCSQVSRAQRIFEMWNYSIWYYNGLYKLLYICPHKMFNTKNEL